MRMFAVLTAVSVFLASCGSASQLTAPTVHAVLAPQATAPANLQWYADRAILNSDAAFAWQWFTAPDLQGIEGMREGSPDDLVRMTDNYSNSADFEDFVSETGFVLRDLRFFSDETPCPNCHQWDYVLVGQLPDGTFAGFRASVFWDS